MATLKERLESNAITGTTDEVSGTDATLLANVLQIARGVVEGHWREEHVQSQRARIRALEQALKAVGG